MPPLQRFSTPGNLREPTQADEDAWSKAVKAIIDQFATDEFPQFYDPTETETPHTATIAHIAWTAFPARLLPEATSEEQRWAQADGSRDEQDEYCEWSVERRDDGAIIRVTFTSEVREYWEHIASRDPDRIVELYRELVDASLTREDLFVDGRYVFDNEHNVLTEGRLAHLVQPNNNLGAAVDLAAKATILREKNGGPVTSKQALVQCAQLGNEFRNSDPQIAAAVNDAARSGNEITLGDPPGLYLDGISTAGMVTPDGTDPATFWTVERGDPGHTVRASFSVPEALGYVVGDINLGGRAIRFGAQLADRVSVRLDAVVKPADHQPTPRPCGAP
ncbi:MAG TPA: hypothetical protein VK501_14965 [Baekduia sp.]|uniref:hypothetical protein n=1 Tax=Baekduia sp. TaxID=2600305 RepID=UPI002BFD66B1|nr:hypothetical protein [Baekduia sp.]HMJ35210.1 hypothetical protein [Baekduia sp.]